MLELAELSGVFLDGTDGELGGGDWPTSWWGSCSSSEGSGATVLSSHHVSAGRTVGVPGVGDELVVAHVGDLVGVKQLCHLTTVLLESADQISDNILIHTLIQSVNNIFR